MADVQRRGFSFDEAVLRLCKARFAAVLENERTPEASARQTAGCRSWNIAFSGCGQACGDSERQASATKAGCPRKATRRKPRGWAGQADNGAQVAQDCVVCTRRPQRATLTGTDCVASPFEIQAASP